MKDIFKIIGVIIIGIGIIWGLTYHELIYEEIFAPKFENIRRKTFENTKSYKEGMVQELQNMQFEYVKADEKHKPALASIILHRVVNFNENDLPQDLYNFIQDLKRENR